jgi:hypothetical protein
MNHKYPAALAAAIGIALSIGAAHADAGTDGFAESLSRNGPKGWVEVADGRYRVERFGTLDQRSLLEVNSMPIEGVRRLVAIDCCNVMVTFASGETRRINDIQLGERTAINSRTMMWQHVSMVLTDPANSQPYVRVFTIGQIKSIDIDPAGTVQSDSPSISMSPSEVANQQGVDFWSKQEYGKAIEFFRALADRGNPFAQNSLGVMYQLGQGVPKDEAQAVVWYRKSAEQGCGLGQLDVANLYANSLSIAKDDAQAVFWYRKAAEQGYGQGQYRLGVMYATGRGVAKDYAQALVWYRKAAEQRFPDAQNQIDITQRIISSAAGVPSYLQP